MVGSRTHSADKSSIGGEGGHSSLSDTNLAVKQLMNDGFRSDQIAIGIPMYSRHKVSLYDVSFVLIFNLV